MEVTQSIRVYEELKVPEGLPSKLDVVVKSRAEAKALADLFKDVAEAIERAERRAFAMGFSKTKVNVYLDETGAEVFLSADEPVTVVSTTITTTGQASVGNWTLTNVGHGAVSLRPAETPGESVAAQDDGPEAC